MKERNNLSVALDSLRKVVKLNAISIEESFFEQEPLLQTYFDSPLGSDTDKIVKKMIAASAIRATYDSKHIPQFMKKKIADRNASEAVACLEYVKLNKLKNTIQTQFTANQLEEILKENNVAKKAALVKAVGRRLLLEGVKIGTSAIITTIVIATGAPVIVPAAVVGLIAWAAITVVEHVVPKSVKEKAKEKVRTLTKSAIGKAENAIKKIERKAQELTQKVKPVIEKVKTGVQKVGETIQKGWNWVKEKLFGRR